MKLEEEDEERRKRRAESGRLEVPVSLIGDVSR
jgi:hypothetical protein